MKNYYFPNSNGTELVFTTKPPIPLQKKIDKFCQYNAWSTLELEDKGEITFIDRLHGYIEDGKCYDNSCVIYQKSVKDYEDKQKTKFVELDKFNAKIDKCIEIIEKLFSRSRKFREAKNEIKRVQDTLDKGYVKVNQRVSGSKRQRRFKKNANCRYLTDVEIKNYKGKVEDLENSLDLLEKNIKYETSIENFLHTLGKTPQSMKTFARNLNYKFNNFGDTIYKLSILEELIDKLDKDQYNVELEKFKQVLKLDEEQKVKRENKTKNKTQVYIDDDGNEVKIEDNIEQIIYNLK